MLFEIWCEGDPKRDLTACHLGYGRMGSTLLEACLALAAENEYFKNNFDFTNLTYCGCKLFDNETDARDLYN